MPEKSKRRKSVLFLLLLLISGYFAIKISQKVESLPKVEEYSLEVNNIKETKDLLEVEEYIYYDLDTLEKVQPAMVVKESSVLGSSCSTPQFTYSSEKICSRDMTFDSEFDKDEEEVQVGQTISRNSTITIQTIVVPPLLSGTQQMDTSVRQIQVNEDPKKTALTARPAGEVIEDKIVKNSMAPGDNQTMGIIQKAIETVKKPFGVKYSLSNNQQTQDDTLVVDKYMENNCGVDCQNDSNLAPGKSNSFSSVLANSSNPPGHYERVEEQEVETIEDCDDSDTFVRMELSNTKNVACLPSLKDMILTFTKRIKDQADSLKCSLTGESDEKCVDTATLVIIMESPWGTQKNCTDEGCLNNYNEVRNSTYTKPGEGSGSGVYVLTKCSANVSGAVSNPVQLSCAWDMDYLSKELEYQSHDNLPSEDYPSRIEYIRLQVAHGENRTDEVKSM